MLESKPRADRWFFGLAGLWFVALTLVGFSPTFYWRSNPVPLPFHLGSRRLFVIPTSCGFAALPRKARLGDSGRSSDI